MEKRIVLKNKILAVGLVAQPKRPTPVNEGAMREAIR